MKTNPKSDYLTGYAKPEDIEFQPAPLERPTPSNSFRPQRSPPSPAQGTKKPKKRSTSKPTGPLASIETDQPASQPTGRQIDQSTSMSTDLSATLTAIQSPDKKARRPAAFYITERQSDVLDALVGHFRAAHRVKTDRSALLRAILGKPVLNFYAEETHGEVIGRLVDQLKSQLVGREADGETNNHEEH